MKNIINTLSEKVKEIESVLDISNELDRLTYISKDKLKKLRANPDWNNNYFYETQNASSELSNYKEKYSNLLELFSSAKENLEELTLFIDEMSEEERNLKIEDINQKIKILEIYKIRKNKNLSIDKSAEYCNPDYKIIDDFFQKKFGFLLPEEMKTEDNLIISGRSRFEIQKCKNFIRCKKNKICPEKVDVFNILKTVESHKYGDFITFGDIDKFINLAIDSYYGIGFFGHGVNTNGFFYLRIDNWRKYYFRFHTGGIYTPFNRDEISVFIKSFIKFENNIKGKVNNIQIIRNLDSLEIKIINKNREIKKRYYNGLLTGRIQNVFSEIESEIFK